MGQNVGQLWKALNKLKVVENRLWLLKKDPVVINSHKHWPDTQFLCCRLQGRAFCDIPSRQKIKGPQCCCKKPVHKWENQRPNHQPKQSVHLLPVLLPAYSWTHGSKCEVCVIATEGKALYENNVVTESKAAESLCVQVGVCVLLCPPSRPKQNPTLERHWSKEGQTGLLNCLQRRSD